MIKVETHLFCSPYNHEYWIDLVIDGKVIKTSDSLNKPDIEQTDIWLHKYATEHKELIKEVLNADIKLEEYNDLYHIKKLTTDKWKEK